MLGTLLDRKKCKVTYAETDADCLLIVQTAVDLSNERKVTVVGENTDLLVLF